MTKVPKDLSDWVYRTSMGDFEIGLFCPRCGEPVPIVVTKPPEVRNEILDSRKRIRSATEFFENHFYADGKPKNKEGKRLAKKYTDEYRRSLWRWIRSKYYRCRYELINLFKRSKKVTGD